MCPKMSQGISVLSVAPFCFAFSDRGESPERIEKAGDAGDLCPFFSKSRQSTSYPGTARRAEHATVE